MHCPKCGAAKARLRVVLTARSGADEVVRRRHCRACDHRWYTLQPPETLLQGKAITWPKAGQHLVTLL